MALPIEDLTQSLPRKKARIEGKTNNLVQEKSDARQHSLFAPFRALGLVTNHVPFALQTRTFKGASDGLKTHILTCLGRSWALWEGSQMTLLFAGPDAGAPISCVAFDGDAVWVSAGDFIMKYLRGKEVERLVDPLGNIIASIMVFGTQLLALSQDGRRLVIWSTDSSEVQATILFASDFTATFMLHPATYLNKILVASSQGTMQLWNIRSQTCIHTFPVASLLSATKRSIPSATPVTAISQSPAIDVVGIGFQSGEISIYDIRADERMMRIFMEGGSVRALGFRTDGHPILASGSSAGHIALWDLNAGGRLIHIIRGAHDGAVSSIAWVPNQPLLISSGDDNSVKQWLFDSPTAPPRLLKFRSGHHQPPHLIRYYGDDGKQLLSASRDRSLRSTSVVRDSRSFELSQGSLAKKAASLSTTLTSLKYPPVTSIAYSTTRSKDWEDVITAHSEETFARTWTVLNKRAGKHILTPSKPGKAAPASVKAVCVSACGNFGFAGGADGIVEMWNLQSGVKRKMFQLGTAPTSGTRRTKLARRSDNRVVTGIATDSLNRILISATLDGSVNFFDFHSAKLEHTLYLPSNAVSILLNRSSGLLAVTCDDMTIRIVDVETHKVVRELAGFRGRILDTTFSPDSRWLIATSLDSVVRTFDVPTGRLIDAFRTSAVATSVSFSPTNDFLATSHVDSVGVYLWANRAQYAEVSYRTVNEADIVDVSLPSTQGIAEDDALDALKALTLDSTVADVFTTPDQLDQELVTLTLLPRSRWQTLLNLDVIQQRNKPQEAPKAPEKAPFFLPTLPGVEHRFAVQETAPKQDSIPSRRLDKIAAETESVFLQKLAVEGPTHDYEDLFSYVKTISPAALDLELRSLVTLDHIQHFLDALIGRLRSRRDFEAVQTLQNVFLRMHGETIIANEEIKSRLGTLLEAQRNESARVLELLASSLGTLGFVRDIM